MLHRAAVAIAFVLAACSRAPDMATCRLVGEWKQAMSLPKSLEAEIRASGKDPMAVAEAADAQARAELGVQSDEYFRADGTCGLTGATYAPGDPKAHMTWRLLSDQGDRVSISIPDDKLPDGQWVRTFIFESRDLMREEGGMFDGMKYQRVVVPK